MDGVITARQKSQIKSESQKWVEGIMKEAGIFVPWCMTDDVLSLFELDRAHMKGTATGFNLRMLIEGTDHKFSLRAHPDAQGEPNAGSVSMQLEQAARDQLGLDAGTRVFNDEQRGDIKARIPQWVKVLWTEVGIVLPKVELDLKAGMTAGVHFHLWANVTIQETKRYELVVPVFQTGVPDFSKVRATIKSIVDDWGRLYGVRSAPQLYAMIANQLEPEVRECVDAAIEQILMLKGKLNRELIDEFDRQIMLAELVAKEAEILRTDLDNYTRFDLDTDLSEQDGMATKYRVPIPRKPDDLIARKEKIVEKLLTIPGAKRIIAEIDPTIQIPEHGFKPMMQGLAFGLLASVGPMGFAVRMVAEDVIWAYISGRLGAWVRRALDNNLWKLARMGLEMYLRLEPASGFAVDKSILALRYDELDISDTDIKKNLNDAWGSKAKDLDSWIRWSRYWVYGDEPKQIIKLKPRGDN